MDYSFAIKNWCKIGIVKFQSLSSSLELCFDKRYKFYQYLVFPAIFMYK